jgi:hypothetical protein
MCGEVVARKLTNESLCSLSANPANGKSSTEGIRAALGRLVKVKLKS